MNGMFAESKFTGDISGWHLSRNVRTNIDGNMGMFYRCDIPMSNKPVEMDEKARLDALTKWDDALKNHTSWRHLDFMKKWNISNNDD